MADLTTLELVQAAIGRAPANQTEEDLWTYHISSVSSYINSICDDSFEEIEDDVIRYQSDYYGIIELLGGPVSEVSSVAYFRSGAELSGWYWDGFEQLSVGAGLLTVDVTLTHGWSQVPLDIETIATDASLVAINSFDADDLISYQVGDVNEKYASIKTFAEQNTQSVLDNYRRTEATLRLGGRGLWPRYEQYGGDIQNV